MPAPSLFQTSLVAVNGGSDPAALVVPFGKHKGLTVAELLSVDPSYVDWLLGQAWLAERFAALHAALLTRGAGTDDTPEHNSLQARFLDPLFRTAFWLCVAPQWVAKARDAFWAALRSARADHLVAMQDLVAYWTGGEALQQLQRELKTALRAEHHDYYDALSYRSRSIANHPQLLLADAKARLTEAEQGKYDTRWYVEPVKRYLSEVAIWQEEQAQRLPEAQARLAGAKTEIDAELPALTLGTAAQFEQRGVDVVVAGTLRGRGISLPGYAGRYAQSSINAGDLQGNVELKPAIGDDYPTVMRQMQRLNAPYLVIGSFSGRGVSLPVMCQMFKANGMQVHTVQEIESCIPAARAWVAQ